MRMISFLRWSVVGLLVSAIMAAAVVESPTVTLRDGTVMPQMGIGVYRCEPGEETEQTVQWALELGIRMVDTAAMYENEESVHDAIQKSGIPRDQIFVTSKLDTGDHGYHAAYQAGTYALQETLQMSYIDLFLIHTPEGEKIVETWDALIDLQAEKLVRSIGVSNFGIAHLEAIRVAGRPLPVVNQIEMHPLIYQKRKSLVEYCHKHGIAITAYGSLFSGWTDLYNHPTLKEIAARTGKSIPQILLRWALEHGFIIIPKSSSSKERQLENYNILDFKLTPEEVENLDNLTSEHEFDEYWEDADPIDEEEVDVGDLDLAERIRAGGAEEEVEEEEDDEDDEDEEEL